MPSKQHFETWRCFVCGKRARGTFDRLNERGWVAFCLLFRDEPIFYYSLDVELCPEHDMESDEVVHAFFSRSSWRATRMTPDDPMLMFKREVRKEQKRESERRNAPEGYV